MSSDDTETTTAQAALADALADWSPTPNDHDRYALLVSWGQAARFADASDPVPALIARAAQSWDQRWPDALFDGAGWLQDLEALLDAPDTTATQIIDRVMDLDAHACAARVAHIEVGPLMQQAALMLSVFAESAARAAPMATAFVRGAGVRSEHVEAVVWQAIVDAAAPDHAAPLLDETASARLLDAAAEDGLLVLLPPIASAARAPAETWGKAANDGFAFQAPATPLAHGPDWELVWERPGPAFELVLYGPASLSFEVLVDGAALPVHDDDDGRRAVVLDAPKAVATVGGRRYTLRTP